MTDQAQELTAEERRIRWTTAVDRRTIEMNDAGWWAARLQGVLILMRKDLGELMDALEAPPAEAK